VVGDSDEDMVGLTVGLVVGEFDGVPVESEIVVGIALEAKVGDTDETPIGLALGAKD